MGLQRKKRPLTLKDEKDEAAIAAKAMKLGCTFKVTHWPDPKKPDDCHKIKVTGTAPNQRDFFYKVWDVDPGSFEEANSNWFPEIYKDEKPLK